MGELELDMPRPLTFMDLLAPLPLVDRHSHTHRVDGAAAERRELPLLCHISSASDLMCALPLVRCMQDWAVFHPHAGKKKKIPAGPCSAASALNVFPLYKSHNPEAISHSVVTVVSSLSVRSQVRKVLGPPVSSPVSHHSHTSPVECISLEKLTGLDCGALQPSADPRPSE